MNLSVVEITSILQTIIFFVTFVAAAIYAYFTLGIWKTSIEQSKQNLMPLPVIYARSGIGSSKNRVFRIRNVGYGAALNIEIEDFNLLIKDLGRKYKYILKMSDPNILVRDEERDLLSETYVNGELNPGDDLLFPYLNPEYATKRTVLSISYQDIKGRKYKMKIAFGTGKLNIVDPPKEIKNE